MAEGFWSDLAGAVGELVERGVDVKRALKDDVEVLARLSADERLSAREKEALGRVLGLLGDSLEWVKRLVKKNSITIRDVAGLRGGKR